MFDSVCGVESAANTILARCAKLKHYILYDNLSVKPIETNFVEELVLTNKEAGEVPVGIGIPYVSPREILVK